MKKYLLLITLLIFSWFNPKSMAQFKMPEFEVYGGGFYNRLLPPSDSIKVFSVVTPYFGIGYLMPMSNPDQFISGGVEFNIFSSRTSNNVKFQNHTAAPFLRFKHQILSHFSYRIGVKYNISYLSIISDGDNKTLTDAYTDVLSVDAGFYYRVQNNLNLALKYEAPIVFGKEVSIFPSVKLELLLDINDKLLGLDKRNAKIKKQSKLVLEKSNTAMVILLSSRLQSIKALKEAHYVERAKIMTEKVRKSNESLYLAAKSELNTYPIYFIYTEDLDSLLQNKYEGIFVNENLDKDINIKFDYETFLIGRKGSQIDGENKSENSTLYRVNDFENNGFYIYDQNFNLLKTPFPSYTRSYFYPSDTDREYNANIRLLSRVNWRIQMYFYKMRENEVIIKY